MRTTLRAVALAFIFARSPAPAAQPGWPEISLTSPITGFSFPVHIAHAGDGSNRLFVAELGGRIRLVKNGAAQSVPFLDISDRVGGGQGLLSVAFPPDYAIRGHFYVNYTAKDTATLVVSRFSLTAQPDVADASSEQIVISIPKPPEYPGPAIFHSGGELAFGPDGFLYFGVGDGDTGADPGDALHLAQDLSSLRGKILRLDVETGSPVSYSIPPTNPFGSSPHPEIWALGVRNPWRSSFDRATGDFYIADVGQNSFEEINFQPAGGTGGQNFGWRIMEGSQCHDPLVDCDPGGLLTLPVGGYTNTRPVDCSITGGRVYRGTTYPRMQGVYFYGDYCSGKISGLRRQGGAWESMLLRGPAAPGEPIASEGLISFGETEGGDIYVTDSRTGTIYKIIDTGPPQKLPQTITFAGPVDQPFHFSPTVLSATASSGLTVSFSIVSGPATVSGTDLTLSGAGAITVRSSQAGDATYDPAPNVERSFVVSSNFASWQNSKFTAAELALPGVSGATAVFGADGLRNLVKYALGLEPKQNITSGLPAISVAGSEWRFTYTRPTFITDVIYAVEISTNLSTWTTTGITHELVSSNGGIDTWRGRYLPGSAPNAFFRLNITLP